MQTIHEERSAFFATGKESNMYRLQSSSIHARFTLLQIEALGMTALKTWEVMK